MSDLAAALAATPDVVAALLHAHVPDEHGRCATCVDRTARAAWPCRLRVLAEQAAALNGARPAGVSDGAR